MKNLFIIADGILDSAAEEYLIDQEDGSPGTNRTIEGITGYAENWCDMIITEADAERIKKCIDWYINYDGNTMDNDYYFNVKKPLMN